MDLNILWFVLLGVLLVGYAILDGFDLGVGILHPLVKGESERRIVLNSIGPLWDGNEVWLVTFAGALFAAFPEVYATLLTAFYLPVMLILLGLIGRAISLEFRSKRRSALWRRYWDYSFFVSSLVVTSLFGLALGNVVVGIPIDARGEFAGTLGGLFGIIPLAVAALTTAGAAMHGSIFLYLKTEGALQQQARRWMVWTFAIFAPLYAGVSVLVVTRLAHATTNFAQWPLAWVLVVLNVLAVANIPRAIHQQRPVYAFVSSSCTIAALTFLVAMALFPNLARSTLEPAHSITIYNGAASQHTLGIMSIVALIGMPLIALYTGIVYWVFRGKVKLGENAY